MSVEILERCPSCGVCSRKGVCPTDAIKVENGKTFIADGCIDCGLCIPVCPIGLIVQIEDESVFVIEPTPESEAEAQITVVEGEEASNGTKSTSTGA